MRASPWPCSSRGDAKAHHPRRLSHAESAILFFISGTLGLDPDGRLAGDFEAQAIRVWSNIDATLKAAGMERSNLAKLTIWPGEPGGLASGAEIQRKRASG
jgi:enamine deaminase RidA (YjgF/YER057c/UK114 family)